MQKYWLQEDVVNVHTTIRARGWMRMQNYWLQQDEANTHTTI